jgi:hypothetical protein
MNDLLPPIYFYLPKPYFLEHLPASAEENWSGFGLGIYAWTLQTYLHLKKDGFPCQLTNHLPSEGIVLLHHNISRVHQKPVKPSSKLLLICLKADGKREPYAQLHVVQNPQEANPHNGCYYIPHWPQPGLVPRSQQRGDRLENIAYFGHATNLAPELQSPFWERQLAALGMCWRPIVNHNGWNNFQQIDNRWNDYSEIDAIIAVRSFREKRTYPDKPATKLYNAWLASVPALLGAESAYRTEGQNQVNYLEVSSPDELIAALKRLQQHPSLRDVLVSNGSLAARAFLPEKITQKWRNFLLEIAVPAFDHWLKLSNYNQQIILKRNLLMFMGEKIKSKLLLR